MSRQIWPAPFAQTQNFPVPFSFEGGGGPTPPNIEQYNQSRGGVGKIFWVIDGMELGLGVFD